jgi:RHS repeat-associated protein
LPNGIATRYVYNADNTLQQLTNLRGSLVLSQHSYTYDQVGNRRTQAEESCEPVTYTYDELNRLLEVRHTTTNLLMEGYTYDALGNRLTKTTPSRTEAYIYDPANQLAEVHQGTPAGPLLTSLHYDDNGNLVAKTDAAGVTQLTYDAFNQLVQANKTWEAQQSYAYDDQGRRISKTAGSITTNYLYNGLNLFAEYGATWNNAAARYTHGPGVDAPISRATPTAAQYYHQDGLGSVVGVSDQSGATTATAHYDSYGLPTAKTGNIFQYGYTGREPDETGLVYYRSRYYDPTLGRFAQRDPIEFQGGLNLYAYAGGNPVNFTDPMGTNPQSPTLPSTDGGTNASGAGNVSGGGMSSRNQSMPGGSGDSAQDAILAKLLAGLDQGVSDLSGLPQIASDTGSVLSDANAAGIPGSPTSSPSLTLPQGGGVSVSDQGILALIAFVTGANPGATLYMDVNRGALRTDFNLSGPNSVNFSHYTQVPGTVTNYGTVTFKLDLTSIQGASYLQLVPPGLQGPVANNPPVYTGLSSGVGNFQACNPCNVLGYINPRT